MEFLINESCGKGTSLTLARVSPLYHLRFSDPLFYHHRCDPVLRRYVHRFWYTSQSLPSSPGFHGDLNATYPVGNIDDESKKLIRVTRETLDESIKLCKPGALFRDLGKPMQVFSNTFSDHI
jgi:methionine aminopeptidase